MTELRGFPVRYIVRQGLQDCTSCPSRDADTMTSCEESIRPSVCLTSQCQTVLCPAKPLSDRSLLSSGLGSRLADGRVSAGGGSASMRRAMGRTTARARRAAPPGPPRSAAATRSGRRAATATTTATTAASSRSACKTSPPHGSIIQDFKGTSYECTWSGCQHSTRWSLSGRMASLGAQL